MKQNGHYTVFAPTDQAFANLDEVQRQKILSGTGCSSSKQYPLKISLLEKYENLFN